MASSGIANQILQEEITFFLAVNTAGVVETLLYGVHLVLFCICMYILTIPRNLKSRSTQWFIFGSAFVMFALSTADISITIRVLTHDIVDALNPEKLPGIERRVYAKNQIFVSNNFIADLVLLFRCYMVWGRSKYILIGASLLVLADTVWGYVGLGESLASPSNTFIRLYIWTIFGINILLTSVTVGRIFWVSRMATQFTGRRHLSTYHTAVAVIVESSLVYTACILVYLLFPVSSWYQLVTITIGMRVVAIMPTFLIVQVGLGRVVRDIDPPDTTATISQCEFVERSENAIGSVVPDNVFTTGAGSMTQTPRSRRVDDEEAPDSES